MLGGAHVGVCHHDAAVAVGLLVGGMAARLDGAVAIPALCTLGMPKVGWCMWYWVSWLLLPFVLLMFRGAMLKEWNRWIEPASWRWWREDWVSSAWKPSTPGTSPGDGRSGRRRW